jgi:hypothetical protein
VFASVGPNFRHAIFGRDSIEVAEDVYLYDQQLAHDIIITLARLQGTKNDQQTEKNRAKFTTNTVPPILPTSRCPNSQLV